MLNKNQLKKKSWVQLEVNENKDTVHLIQIHELYSLSPEFFGVWGIRVKKSGCGIEGKKLFFSTIQILTSWGCRAGR